jgi:hypothetical protein
MWQSSPSLELLSALKCDAESADSSTCDAATCGHRILISESSTANRSGRHQQCGILISEKILENSIGQSLVQWQ